MKTLSEIREIIKDQGFNDVFFQKAEALWETYIENCQPIYAKYRPKFLKMGESENLELQKVHIAFTDRKYSLKKQYRVQTTDYREKIKVITNERDKVREALLNDYREKYWNLKSIEEKNISNLRKKYDSAYIALFEKHEEV